MPIDDFISRPQFSDFRVPEMPSLSEFVRKHGLMVGVQQFGEALRKWRTDLERVLIERLKAFERAVVQQEATDSPDTTPVMQSDFSGVEAQVTQLVAQVNQALADLQAHIAATVVHGTASNVVGETDEQALEAKTIGQASPRLATFTHALQRNSVPASEMFVIPAGHNMVVAGTFDVYGTMSVDGYFAMV